MSEYAQPFDAKIVHDLPDDLTKLIGQVMVSYARLEHALTMLTAFLLQLNKAEARIVLREPRASDRLDMALDIFALKAIELKTDADILRERITQASTGRDLLAHGIWLKHPETEVLFLRKTRGKWPKDLSKGQKISRAIFPQSVRYSAEDCKKTLDLIEQAIVGVDELGGELDAALKAFPERFRPPSPLLNPLGVRSPKDKKPPHGS